MALSPVCFKFSECPDEQVESQKREEGETERRKSSSPPRTSISSHIRQLQEQLQFQPGFAPGSASPPTASPPLSPDPSPATFPSPGPRLDVRRKQLAIQLGSEMARRQEASLRAHHSADRAKPLRVEQYEVTHMVGDLSHVGQRLDAASLRLRDTTVDRNVKSGLPSKLAAALAPKGWNEAIKDKWAEVTDVQVEALLDAMRNAVPSDSWDATRVLTLSQRSVLAKVFGKVVGAPVEELVSSPASVCRCLVALCDVSILSPSHLQDVLEQEALNHVPTYPPTPKAKKSPLVTSRDCRAEPYPSPPPDAPPLQRSKCGKLSAVKKRQLEVLLTHAKHRQEEEMSYHERVEGRRPLQDYHISNGSKLGTTPILHSFLPCPSPTPFLKKSKSDAGTLDGSGALPRSDSPMSEMSVDSIGSFKPSSLCLPEPPLVSSSTSSSFSSAVPQALLCRFSSVPELLSSLGLTQYAWKLKQRGYDLPTDLEGIAKDELLSIGLLPGHAQRLLNAVAKQATLSDPLSHLTPSQPSPGQMSPTLQKLLGMT